MGLLIEGRSTGPRVLIMALVLVAWLVPWGSVRAAGEPVLTINQVKSQGFPAVVAYVTVSDQSGIPIIGLSKAHFEAFEDGRAVHDLAVSTAIDSQEGIGVILAIDTSGSMRGQPIKDAQEAAKVFVGDLTDSDQAAIVGFGAQVDLLQDFTGKQADLNTAIESLTAEGNTALYDAIYDAVGQAARLPPGRKTVLILTDGEDTESSVTLDDAIDRARELNVPVFAVGLGKIVADPLKRLTKLTGGRYLESPSSAELMQRFKLISDQLRHQYVVTYRSRVPPDEAQHTLVLKMNHQGGISQDSRPFFAPSMTPSIALPSLKEGVEVAGEVEVVPLLEVNISAPLDGAEVGGQVAIEVSITAFHQVASVDYLIDDQVIATVAQAPFSYQWDISGTPLGDHTLAATVQDQVGNEAQAIVRIRVVPLLEVDILSPLEGAKVTSQVVVEPSIMAFHPVASVDYLLDGQLLITVDQAPFSYPWDLAGVTAGQHTLTLRVRDSKGNSAEVIRRVHVVAPLAINIISPSAGAEIRGLTTLSVAVAPTDGAERVEYLLDGQTLATVTEVPYDYEWDPAGMSGGPHILTVRAYGEGQTAQDQMDLILAAPVLPWGVIFGLAAVVAATIPFLVAARRRGTRSTPSITAATGEALAPPEPGRPVQGWLVEKGGEGRRWQLREGRTLIGREVGASDILIDDVLASREHAEIRSEGSVFVFYDLTPTNPSLINGVEYQGPHRLRAGDSVMVGDTVLVVE